MLKLTDEQVIQMVDAMLEYECVRPANRECRVRERSDGLPSVLALAPIFDRYERIIEAKVKRNMTKGK